MHGKIELDLNLILFHAFGYVAFYALYALLRDQPTICKHEIKFFYSWPLSVLDYR